MFAVIKEEVRASSHMQASYTSPSLSHLTTEGNWSGTEAAMKVTHGRGRTVPSVYNISDFSSSTEMMK